MTQLVRDRALAFYRMVTKSPKPYSYLEALLGVDRVPSVEDFRSHDKKAFDRCEGFLVHMHDVIDALEEVHASRPRQKEIEEITEVKAEEKKEKEEEPKAEKVKAAKKAAAPKAKKAAKAKAKSKPAAKAKKKSKPATTKTTKTKARKVEPKLVETKERIWPPESDPKETMTADDPAAALEAAE